MNFEKFKNKIKMFDGKELYIGFDFDGKRNTIRVIGKERLLCHFIKSKNKNYDRFLNVSEIINSEIILSQPVIKAMVNMIPEDCEYQLVEKFIIFKVKPLVVELNEGEMI